VEVGQRRLLAESRANRSFCHEGRRRSENSHEDDYYEDGDNGKDAQPCDNDEHLYLEYDHREDVVNDNSSYFEDEPCNP